MTRIPVPITEVGLANNHFRKNALKGNPGHHRIVATQGVHALGPIAVQEVLDLVLRFPDASFRESFEPFGDRDFVVVGYQGIKVWAKIDTYDPSMKFMSENPADDDLTIRVLSLMLPDEY